jgi:hypothetical protein
MLVTAAGAVPAGAQELAPLPPPARLEAPAAPPRPRLNAAIGAGVSFDDSGFSPSRYQAVPAMFATGGVGADWPVGGELSIFASSAVGRFRSPDMPVDRLAIALVGVVRPLAWKIAVDDSRFAARLLRASGVELGPGLERDGTTLRSGSRFGLHAGLRLEIPLARAGQRTELRVRLAARYLRGFYTPRVAMTDVGDSIETYAAIVSVF